MAAYQHLGTRGLVDTVQLGDRQEAYRTEPLIGLRFRNPRCTDHCKLSFPYVSMFFCYNSSVNFAASTQVLEQGDTIKVWSAAAISGINYHWWLIWACYRYSMPMRAPTSITSSINKTTVIIKPLSTISPAPFSEMEAVKVSLALPYSSSTTSLKGLIWCDSIAASLTCWTKEIKTNRSFTGEKIPASAV